MHHAYFYEGTRSLLPVLVESAKKELGFPGEHNPDVHIYEYEKCGIEEARALIEEASLKSLSGRALYIVGVSVLSTEAQQALLKLFEEPQEGVVFVLLVPYGALIATLRSRFLSYPYAVEEADISKASASKFLKAPYKERSTQIGALLKDEEDARERVREFLQGLEVVLHMQFTKDPTKKDIRDGLEDIARVRSYAGDRSPSLKMLLEHLAATLPTL